MAGIVPGPGLSCVTGANVRPKTDGLRILFRSPGYLGALLIEEVNHEI